MRQTGRPRALEDSRWRTSKATSGHHFSRISRTLCPYAPAAMGIFRFPARPTTEMNMRGVSMKAMGARVTLWCRNVAHSKHSTHEVRP